MDSRRALLGNPQPITFDSSAAGNALETSLNVFWSCVPSTVIAPIIATAISEAIRAYSMAVAPVSLATNFVMEVIM